MQFLTQNHLQFEKRNIEIYFFITQKKGISHTERALQHLHKKNIKNGVPSFWRGFGKTQIRNFKSPNITKISWLSWRTFISYKTANFENIAIFVLLKILKTTVDFHKYSKFYYIYQV